MPEGVGGDVLGLQRRALSGCGGGVLGEAFLDGVAAESSAGAVREQGLLQFAVPFAEPGTQDGDGDRGERGDPFFSPLAVAGDVRPTAEVRVAEGQPG
jgi:hypothetical protein